MAYLETKSPIGLNPHLSDQGSKYTSGIQRSLAEQEYTAARIIEGSGMYRESLFLATLCNILGTLDASPRS